MLFDEIADFLGLKLGVDEFEGVDEVGIDLGRR